MSKKMIIKPDPKNEIPAEIIAASIIKISEAMDRINQSRLTRSAIVALIHDKSQIRKTDIEIVLNNLEQMEKQWLKPKRQSA